MTDRISDIVTGLPQLRSVNDLWHLAERRLAAGDAAFLGDLGVALTERYGSETRDVWQYGSVMDQLLRLLALTPGAANVAQAARLAGGGGRARTRYTAVLLACGKAPAELAGVFSGGGVGGGGTEELRACLVHELVLRGVCLDETPAIARWAASPHWRHHPLGRLPLSLTALEATPPMPGYHLSGSSHGMPERPAGGHRIQAGAENPALDVVEVTTAEDDEAIGAAVAGWFAHSNGRHEARVYELAGPATPEDVAAVLPTLDLACLRDADPLPGLVPCAPEAVWRMLFVSASTGGAYGGGEHGAYGRLAAWRSLGGLAGCPGDDPAEIEPMALACSWFGLDPLTGWFADVAWDVTAVALGPDRRRLAVLAATDTD
ncbi:DUF6183 family protein [Catellatospora sichuanensis]|uniref:DUF6183 family protein n=1 Tax=Catellatospora sichuanensis TaxID=1969805 RepID=UPI0011820028|nr:DUF6183 family protein [Catellatospora sichuanensis]